MEKIILTKLMERFEHIVLKITRHVIDLEKAENNQALNL
jgi:hypothetical protein